MAKYQNKEWHTKQKHLSMELLNSCHIYGDTNLSKGYDNHIQAKLNLPYNDTYTTIREYLAKKHLVEDDFKHFDPGMNELSKRGQLFKAKNDFYRFAHLAIDRLAWAYKIEETNTFKRIYRLQEKQIFTQEAAQNLEWLMGQAMYMRLKTYCHYKSQKEEMNPLIRAFGFQEKENIQFAIKEEGLKNIKKNLSNPPSFLRSDEKTFNRK